MLELGLYLRVDANSRGHIMEALWYFALKIEILKYQVTSGIPMNNRAKERVEKSIDENSNIKEFIRHPHLSL